MTPGRVATKWFRLYYLDGLECWTQVNFTRARGPGFDSWTDRSKIARPQDSHVVTWLAGDQEKHD